MYPGIIDRLEAGRLFCVDTGLSWSRWFSSVRLCVENPANSGRRVVVYALAASSLIGRVAVWRDPSGFPSKRAVVQAGYHAHKRQPVTIATGGGGPWAWRVRQSLWGGERVLSTIVTGRTVLHDIPWVLSPGERYGFELMAVGVGGLTAYLWEDGE